MGFASSPAGAWNLPFQTRLGSNEAVFYFPERWLKGEARQLYPSAGLRSNSDGMDGVGPRKEISPHWTPNVLVDISR